MTLKDRFENYEIEPDAKVWEGVSKSIRRRRLRRNSLYAAGAVAVVAAVVVLSVGRPASEKEAVVTAQLQETGVPVAAMEAQETITSAIATTTSMVSSTNADNEHQASLQQTPATMEMTKASSAVQQAEEQRVIVPVPVVSEELDFAALLEEISSSVSENNTEAPVVASSEKKMEQQPTPKVSTLNKDFVDFKAFLPTAISPDNGTDVGVFKVDSRVMDYIPFDNYKMYIYNRGGRMVYYTTTYTEGWDGVNRGVKQPKGSYVYVIEYRDVATGEVKRVTGSFLLVR